MTTPMDQPTRNEVIADAVSFVMTCQYESPDTIDMERRISALLSAAFTDYLTARRDPNALVAHCGRLAAVFDELLRAEARIIRGFMAGDEKTLRDPDATWLERTDAQDSIEHGRRFFAVFGELFPAEVKQTAATAAT